MRPKKRILVFSSDVDELGRIGYLLWVRGFEAVLADSGKQVLLALANGTCDCVAVMATVQQPVAEAVLRALAAARPDVPTVAFTSATGPLGAAAASMVRRGVSAAEMVETLRLLVTRKRGPRRSSSTGRAVAETLNSNLQRVEEQQVA